MAKKTFLFVLIIMIIALSLTDCNSLNQPGSAISKAQTSSTPSAQKSDNNQKNTLSDENESSSVKTETPEAKAPPSSSEKIKSSGSGAVIAFTFDDGYVSDYKIVFPILKKYGIKGTSYIIPGFMNNNSTTRLTWDEVKEMVDYGWVFGCHTFEHKDLKTLSAEKLKQSMQAVDKAFEGHGLKPPLVGAYPYGSYDDKVINIIRIYRKQERKAFYEEKFVDLKHTDPYRIDSISADIKSKSRLSILKVIVDKACRLKTVIVFRAHSMFKNKKNDTGRFLIQTDSRLFEKLVSYCVDKDCIFVTMEELMKMYET